MKKYWYVLFVLGVVLAGYGACHLWVPYVASVCVYPVYAGVSYIVDGIAEPFMWIKDRGREHDELRELRRTCARLRERVIALEATHQHVEQTRAHYDFARRYTSDYGRVARVIAATYDEAESTLWLDKGSCSGIQEGMVVTHQTCLVGRITRVFPFYSKVATLYDSSVHVACYGTQNSARGVHMIDRDAGEPCVAYISPCEAVDPGEYMVSQGTGAFYPRGFGVARVIDILPGDTYCTARVAPLLDFRQIEYCTVFWRGEWQMSDSSCIQQEVDG